MNFIRLIFIIFVVSLLTSCAPFIQTISSFSWYRTKQLSTLPEVSLNGKTILIDPGHGNNFSGSIGKHGTKEKEINLKVALILKTLLQKQGATVYMTREGEKSLWWNPQITNRDDLRMRCHMRDSLMPDLFVSIHHNGSENGSLMTNNSKLFYAPGDPDASLDAAEYISMEFSSMLGLKQNIVSPANYYILRNTKVPSLLGEPSYLSNPAMERRLRDSTALYWEATAYYRGIINWFSGGIPKINSFTLDTLRRNITVSITSDTVLDSALTGIFCDQVRLDGYLCSSGYRAVIPFFLENKEYTFTCKACNVRGNCATSIRFTCVINRPVVSLTASVDPEALGGLSRMRATALDIYGYPVMDGTPVFLNKTDTAQTEHGVALFYVPVTDSVRQVDISCSGITIPVTIAAGSCVRHIQGFVVSSDSFTCSNCLISCNEQLYSTDKSGFFSIPVTGTRDTVQALFSSTGFEDSYFDLTYGIINKVKILPRLQGIFFNKKIVIDPEFGGIESGGVNALGIRACDITRKISSQIAGELREYGAQIRMAREGDQTVHVVSRIVCAENFNADLYIVVRSDSVNEKPYISYSPGSISGKKIAQILSKQWLEVSGNLASVQEEPSVVLMQTSCPAVILSLHALNSKKTMSRKDCKDVSETVRKGLVEFFRNP